MYRDGHCSVITKVYPSQLQVTLATTLDISIEHFPRLEGQFMCVFTAHGVSLSSPANKTSTGVTCRTPPTTQVVSIPVGMQYYIAKLSVQVSGSPNFVTTDFIFYNCVRFSSCTACTNSSFACDWCRTNHRCTHDTGTYCRDDHIITGLNTPGPSIRPGPDHCPRINSTRPEFLIPSGTEYQIAVHASNVEEIDPSPFQCEFNLDGRISDVEAVYEDGFIKCNYHLFKYDSPAKSIEAQFAILWGGTRALDNPNNILITVYRCEEMAKQCGFCLTLDQRYRCGWCGGACTIAEMCGTGEWLSNGAICPNPTIEKFSPRMGPYEGGTNITISGYNLGLNYDDIKSGVTVAGQICMPYEELYVRTKQIVCKAGESSKGNKGYLQVMVRGDSRYIGVSDMEFAYVDPKINKTWPKVGPKSGGTKITITGRHMDAGSHITAFIVWDEPTGQTRSPCEVIRTSHKEVDCLTSASSKATPGRIVMRFDSAERHSTETFTYHDDPVILDVLPSGGIPSGGNDIYVIGLNLNVVQDPQMFVSLDGKEFIGRCDGLNSSLMVCKSPIIMSTSVPGPNDPPSLLDYGFNMDNVTRLRNIPSLPNFSKFTLYPDPVVYNFTEKNQVKRYKSDYLAISIRNLCEVCSMQEFFEVRIGSEFCNVTSVAPNLLNCQPPGAQPTSRADGADPKSLPEVTVVIGNSREFLIGYLQYETESGRLPLWGIIAIAVAAGILLFIVFVILIAYRHQSSKSERVLKNMQEQMDVLELRVAAECKEAFAELQTDMTFLTGDISGYGIPFMDYKYYSLKVLFPNQDDHPVLRELDVDPRKRKSVEKALRQFGHLIMNKTFLLLFIGTLESNKYFSMKDRVNVASLIMVALQSKMEYCTDILKTLLADLIEKSIVGNSHPKLLLRRTESVAEKMLTAWFTFLLYRFLRECAGEPLFLLYMAIQQQIEKGPVDAVTNEAKYSLSEEKLIRQQIDYRQMTVYVSGLDPSNENQETPVKVLNCDTISEVKEKALNAIYKSTPYSLRPTKNDLDLEWRTGVSGRLVLQDDDISTKPEGEWKRLNTLAHYKVPDGASLALVPKQSSIFNLSMSLLSDRSDHSHRHGAYLAENSSVHTASQPLSRAMSPMDHHHTLESGIKYWHLIKPMDSNNEREGERSSKLVSEIYLTRLLATKGTLQKFVDDLFETIFSTHQRGNALPLAIKYMFDFLDDQALLHGITDPEVVHTWKSNSLPLRFWVNLIKNPNFVFDIHKSTIQDACLSVIAQTFMDACSTSEHRLGKDSPASKLLYAKDIPTYKEWVEKYYQDIKLMAAISDQDMNAMLAEESRTHVEEFNVNVSLFELYGYACKYNDQLMQTLQDDEFSRKNRLAYKLEQVHNAIAETDA
ncbi:PREDICTED: plexin-A2-like [Priapulus caudatus]|uniref:Plexin-A2-like n=1 Tax=Priapulus caudatus TaxID=37621 RepID=A0ABM1E745_PRICU|nr:PREDICTED: plexin-A2-like [Priapulus caudatus]